MVTAILAIVTAFLGGFSGGLLGIGGGFIMVPLLMFVFKLNAHRAIGTSLALIVVIALAGSIRNCFLGNVDIKLVLLMAAIAAVGSLLGVQFSISLPVVALRRIFAICLVVVAAKMFIG